MPRMFCAGIAIVVVAEGILVTVAPLMAVLFSAALLVAATHLWSRRSRGRRAGTQRRAWTAPASPAASAVRRAA